MSYTNLSVKQQFPCFSTQTITDKKFDNVKGYVEDHTVDPYNTGPAPPDATDLSKADMSIHSNQGSHLFAK